MEFKINVFDLEGSKITKDNYEYALSHILLEAEIVCRSKIIDNFPYDSRIVQLERLNNIACMIANEVSVESSKGFLFPEYIKLAESLISNINAKIISLRYEAESNLLNFSSHSR